jgi:hypothetical protein
MFYHMGTGWFAPMEHLRKAFSPTCLVELVSMQRFLRAWIRFVYSTAEGRVDQLLHAGAPSDILAFVSGMGPGSQGWQHLGSVMISALQYIQGELAAGAAGQQGLNQFRQPVRHKALLTAALTASRTTAPGVPGVGRGDSAFHEAVAVLAVHAISEVMVSGVPDVALGALCPFKPAFGSHRPELQLVEVAAEEVEERLHAAEAQLLEGSSRYQEVLHHTAWRFRRVVSNTLQRALYPAPDQQQAEQLPGPEEEVASSAPDNQRWYWLSGCAVVQHMGFIPNLSRAGSWKSFLDAFVACMPHTATTMPAAAGPQAGLAAGGDPLDLDVMLEDSIATWSSSTRMFLPSSVDEFVQVRGCKAQQGVL